MFKARPFLHTVWMRKTAPNNSILFFSGVERARRYSTHATHPTIHHGDHQGGRQTIDAEGMFPRTSSSSSSSSNSSGDESSTFSLQAMQRATKYHYLRGCFRTTGLAQIPIDEFYKMCMERAGMTDEEARTCLVDFNEAGLVVVVRTTVFLYPSVVYQAAHEAIALAYDPAAPLRMKRNTLTQALTSLQSEKDRIDASVVISRRRFWCGVALYSSAQMFLLCHFTFVDFDWDIMEPVTYFVTSATALALYAWFLRHGVSSSFENVDQKVLSKRLRRAYQTANFPYQTWYHLMKEKEALDAEITRVEEWARIQG